jgi:hypothetical protein
MNLTSLGHVSHAGVGMWGLVESDWAAQIAGNIVLAASHVGAQWLLSKMQGWEWPFGRDVAVISYTSQVPSDPVRQQSLFERVDVAYERSLPDHSRQTQSLTCGLGLMLGAAGSIASHHPLPLALGSTLCVPGVSASEYLFSPPDASTPANLLLASRMSALAETQHSRLVATNSGLWSISCHDPLIQWHISSSAADIVSAANIVVNQQQLFVLVDNTRRLVTCYSDAGTILWNAGIAGDAVANLVIDSNAVYVSYSAPEVQPVVTKVSALAINTGSALWTTAINNGAGSMTMFLFEPMLILSMQYREAAYALSTTSGAVAWQPGGTFENVFPGPSSSSVTLDGGGDNLYTFDAVSGSLLSSTPYGCGIGDIETVDFVADGGAVFVLGTGGVSYLLIDGSTMDVQWTYDSGSIREDSLVVHSPLFYVINYDHNNVLAVTTSNPPLLSWQWDSGWYRAIAKGQNGLIVYSRNGDNGPLPVVCLDYSSGSLVWTSPLQCQISHLFSIENGVIKLSCDAIALAIINATTGAVMNYATDTKSSSLTRTLSMSENTISRSESVTVTPPSTPTYTASKTSTQTDTFTASKTSSQTNTLSSTQLPPVFPPQTGNNIGLIIGATMGGVTILASSVTLAACLIRAYRLKKTDDDAVTETSRLNSEPCSRTLLGQVKESA